MKNITKLFLTMPLPASKYFHIFRDREIRSLCGKFRLLGGIVEDYMFRVKGTEKYKRGQDCKACFKKAGLAVTPSEKRE